LTARGSALAIMLVQWNKPLLKPEWMSVPQYEGYPAELTLH